MSAEALRWLGAAAPLALLVLGLGFLVANLLLLAQLVAFQVRKRSALVIWDAPKPPYHAVNLGLGVAFGALLAVEVFFLDRPLQRLFGEGMMFLYYGYAYPLSTRIAHGFYRDGVWTGNGFLPWKAIAAVSWKEADGHVVLMLISRGRNLARRLMVPGHLYGQARRTLLDRIKAHDIQMGGTGLDLGSRGEEAGI